jgi:hypothetical protein
MVIECAETGQDGELQMGAAWPSPRFKDNSNQTVTDNLTGLIWTKDGNTPSPSAWTCSPGVFLKTWQGALDHVKCLNANSFLGHNDWRLPNVNELESLVNYGQNNPVNWLNSNYFTNVQIYYWSSSTGAISTLDAWWVNMTRGRVQYDSKSEIYYVWPVRGGLSVLGDMNGDGLVGLADVILILKIVASMNASGQSVDLSADVNADGRIGLPEAMFALQQMAGLRLSTNPTYTVSGNVTSSGAGDLAGVTVNLSGGSISLTTTTDANGNYSFSSVPDGAYTLTLSLVGYVFNSMTVTVAGADLSNQNSVGTTATFSINGVVTANGTGLAAVTVSLTGAASETTETDTNGHYSFSSLVSGTYTVTPARIGYTFTPETVNISGADITKDFTATPVTTLFGATGWWDLYIPFIEERKMDQYYVNITGSDISGTKVDNLNQGFTGSIIGTTVTLTSGSGDSFIGTLNGNTISGTYSRPGYGSAAATFIESSLRFTNFYPGDEFNTAMPQFTWTASSGAQKYFIRILKGNTEEVEACDEITACTTIWSRSGVANTSIIFNNDGTASEQLMPGYNYWIRIFSQTNSQTEFPQGDDPSTYVDMTTDVAFRIKNVTFANSDLPGTWHLQALASGNTSGQLPGWISGSIAIDGSGNSSFSSLVDSAGTAPYAPTASVLGIDANGKITPTHNNTGQWIMTQGKDKMVFVSTGALGNAQGVRGYNLALLIKADNGFSSADIQGSWTMNLLHTNSSTQNGWAYGTLTVSDNGSSVMTFIKSNGQQTTDSSKIISVNSLGEVTVSPDSDSVHGFMSSNKDMVVATMKDNVGAPDFLIMTRRGGTFSLADLQGKWNVQMITAGNGSQWAGWAYGTTVVNCSGNLFWTSIMRSDGNTTLPPDASAFFINANGIVTSSNMPSFHGVMSRDKETLVATMDDGGGGSNLMIFTKGNQAGPGGSYYEIYGAQQGDYELTHICRPLLGTSLGGNSFNVSGYQRFILYVPAASSKILFDAIGLGAGWLYSMDGSEYAHYERNICPTGGSWEQNDSCIEGAPDGITMENTPGRNSYYGFSTKGASTLEVYVKEN